MRSRDDSVPEDAAVERALTLGLCGIGGRLERPPVTMTDAVRAADAQLGERVARRLERFASAPDGAFVWTRDVDGLLWLGRLGGPWRYDADPDAARVDLVHVRRCEWLPAPVDAEAVPAGVRATYARGGRNWQRIHHPDVSPATTAIWHDRADG